MRRFVGLLVPVGVLAALVLAPTAAAEHNADQHSANTSLLFQSPNATGATNSDIAFWGNRAYVGNYDGIRIYDISNPAAPALLGDFRCHGPQNDMVVWQNRLMFTAIDRTQSGPNCGSTDVAHDDPNGWEGVRIFDVSNPASVRQIGAVYQDCGSHTITLHPAGNVLHLYNSSYPLRPGPTCGPVRGTAAGRDPLHGVIQVIEVPLADPAAAREIAEPRINYPGDPDNRFDPAEHALPGFLPMRACHDLGVLMPLRLVAAACVEQVQLWRIGANGLPDTENPLWVYMDQSDTDGAGGGDVGVDFWHSATFSWDGKLVNFIDESFGAGCPTVTPIGLGAAARPSDTGRMFFLDRATGRKLSHFQLPRPEVSPDESDYCSAHLGTVAPAIGRYLLANAWYTGGMDIVDFTRPAAPTEAAFYDVAGTFGTPGNPATFVQGSDTWSVYWYENVADTGDTMWIWANDIIHGFRVFRTILDAPDIAFRRLNPQTQEDLLTCRVTVSPRRLRATQSRPVAATVTIRPGVAILPGQRVPDVRVRLRGPGISVSTMTNSRGVARISGVTASRRGTLRVSVPAVPNMVGCRTTARIAAAPRGGVGGAVGGAELTGRR